MNVSINPLKYETVTTDLPGTINPHLPREGERMEECKECDGEGEIDITFQVPRVVECETCDGTGEVPADDKPGR